MGKDDYQLEIDYYQLLGLPRDASQREIIQRYYDLRTSHSAASEDGCPVSRKILDQLDIAKAVLENPEKRKDYDARHPQENGAARQAHECAAKLLENGYVKHRDIDNLEKILLDIRRSQDPESRNKLCMEAQEMMAKKSALAANCRTPILRTAITHPNDVNVAGLLDPFIENSCSFTPKHLEILLRVINKSGHSALSHHCRNARMLLKKQPDLVSSIANSLVETVVARGGNEYISNLLDVLIAQPEQIRPKHLELFGTRINWDTGYDPASHRCLNLRKLAAASSEVITPTGELKNWAGTQPWAPKAPGLLNNSSRAQNVKREQLAELLPLNMAGLAKLVR